MVHIKIPATMINVKTDEDGMETLLVVLSTSKDLLPGKINK